MTGRDATPTTVRAEQSRLSLRLPKTGTLGRLQAASIQLLTLVLGLAGHAALQAQVKSRCADKTVGGNLECSYGPQEVSPWKYTIPGPIKGTRQFFNESDAKSEYEGHLAQNCPGCCNPGSLIAEGQWADSSASSWGPGTATSASKSLTYVVVPKGGDGVCLPAWTFSTTINRFRDIGCDIGWSGSWNDPPPYFCYRSLPPRQECRVSPDPVTFPSGSKFFTTTDYRSPYLHGLAFTRDYRSGGFSEADSSTMANRWAGLSHSWTHNFAGSLSSTADAVWLRWGAGAPYFFAHLDPLSSYPRRLQSKRPGEHVQLLQVTSTRYLFYTAENDLVVFDAGLPIAKASSSGWKMDLAYGVSGLQSVTDGSGRSLTFQYDSDSHLTRLVDPAGESVQYHYKSAPTNPGGTPYTGVEYTTLRQVVFQDGTSWQYIVPDWSLGGGANNWLATRIVGTVDELAVPFQSIEYWMPGGTVKQTSLAGGVSSYSFTGNAVTDPLGVTRTYGFGASQSSPNNSLLSQYQPAGAGCAASAAEQTFDPASWNLTSRTEFNGSKACFSYDAALGRNVELVRVEGTQRYGSCTGLTSDGATLPAGTRKISTQWHPDWRLPTKVAESGRIATYVYNGQPDPLNAGAVASCAPAGAQLPDGKPIAVLCRQVEQATTDANGSLGFTATLQAGVVNREQRWTYNQYGQVLTHDGPRTDVSDITTYTYYGDTSFTGAGSAAVGHTLGDLQSVTTATGQVTQYTKYDKHGQLLEGVDANGVVTTNTYDLRQRLLSSTVAGQATNYTYDAAGQLKRITRPDGSYVGFDYDAAHRQTAAFDNLGNRIEYTLDNAGNRIAESVKDTAGALRRQLARSIDALGRVQQTSGRD